MFHDVNVLVFLNQIHLIFIKGWQLFLAPGWIALGVGTVRMLGRYWFSGCLVWLGGGMILGARYWLPTYGTSAPAGVLLLSGEGFSLGITTGLIGPGLLGWMLEGKSQG